MCEDIDEVGRRDLGALQVDPSASPRGMSVLAELSRESVSPGCSWHRCHCWKMLAERQTMSEAS